MTVLSALLSAPLKQPKSRNRSSLGNFNGVQDRIFGKSQIFNRVHLRLEYIRLLDGFEDVDVECDMNRHGADL